ncbi:hypothetical protein QVD17_12618 [Tagetes erecta]|uniref:Integrase catalytic domain-containing protein n=1 Tax=Tagetes erecta TaxID=13708 RepID=A0AAD8L193_TARER|nr:hypothetical protein QVD17_12618 [Tagetes erecta]
MADKIHPAVTVTNIRNFIPITLEMESGQYNSWAELFKIHCKAFDCSDHLIHTEPQTAEPNPETEKSKDKPSSSSLDTETTKTWNRVDAIVLQWIYGTISNDLLHTILSPDSHAATAWKALENIFQDNRNTRAIYLQHKFSNLKISDFPNVSAYCQSLKMISDQLTNVGAPVTNNTLVLQLISGLNGEYDGIAMLLQQRDPLPDFYEARSKLIMEETRKSNQVTTKDTALAATTDHRDQQQRQSAPQVQQQQSWASPPCPYPTTGQAPSWQPNPGPGLLGPRPNQVHYANSGNYVPTDLDQAFHAMTLTPPDQQWYADTGASSHMTNSGGNFSSYFNNGSKSNIIVGNGHKIPIVGIGTQKLPPPLPPLTLSHVLHAPHLIKNLLSVRRLTTDNNISIEFDPFGFDVKDLKTRKPIVRCDSTGDLYPFTFSSTTSTTAPSAFAAISQDLWHSRLGHPGSSILHALNKVLPLQKHKHASFCSSCVLGKHIKLPFHDSNFVSSLPFDIIHSDVWTSPVPTFNGHKYYVLFLDDKTNFLWTYPMCHKSQVFEIFKEFHTFVQTQFNMPIKTFQCDNGREYNNNMFHTFFKTHGIQFRFSCPHTSSQNGKSERKIRSINNIIRTLLAHSSVPPKFWNHALQTATYLLNILPSKLLQNKSPTQLLYHKQPDYCHLRVFGCLCYPLTPSISINKLQPRSFPCLFLGYPSNHRGYKCYDLSTRKIILSRHVLFDERTFPLANTSSPKPSYDFLSTGPHPSIWQHLAPATTTPPPPSPPPATRFGHTYQRRPKPTPKQPNSYTNQPPSQPSSDTHQPPSQPTSNTNQQPTSNTHQPPSPPTSSTNQQPQPSAPTQTPSCQPPPATTRTMTTRTMSGAVTTKTYHGLTAHPKLSPIPKTLIDAIRCPDWKRAMNDEFGALINNKTWRLVPRHSDMNITRCMWLFKHKHNANGFERYKARLVCDGRSQQVGIDCGETFSPVVKPATIRTVLSIALSHSWSIHQLDVKNAFLHGNLTETVYMHQPPGFRDPQYPDHVCLLQRSLYGLKQAPRAWYQRFADYVASIGFSHSQCDHSLFIYRKGQDIAYILLYVDDIILTTSTPQLHHKIMTLLSHEFAMKDLGPLTYFLGIAVTRHNNTLILSQQKYAKEIIERAGMSSCKPVATPVDTNTKLGASVGDLFENVTLYRQLAGALQYLTFTRPDISYAVQQICIHMHAPRTSHFNALKRILRYLQGTIDFGLTLTKFGISSLLAYTDADWGGCPDTRRSTSGYCVYMGDNLLSWSSKRQSTLSRSSAEAEYRGVANVVSEVSWLRNLLLELHHPPSHATLVYCDNVSAIYLSGNPVQHQRTKHIEMDIHFVREQVRRGNIRVLHVPSRYQIADIFTKGLPRVLFNDFRSSLNIRQPPVSTAGV